MRHTILGIDSSLSKSLATELLTDSHNLVRIVNHHEYWIPGTETLPLDLTSVEEIRKAITGSDIVYLFASHIPMDRHMQENWIRIVKASIKACKWTNSKFIYVDNADIYGRFNGRITENTPCRPCTDSGKVLLDAALLVEHELPGQTFKCIICRTADIYGPYTNSANYLRYNVIERILRNKVPRWFINDEMQHSFTFTTDIARAIRMLVMNEDSNNQIWHLPTENSLSGQTLIHIVSNIVGSDPYYTVLSGASLWMEALLNKEVSVNYNRAYRFENGIIFDSSKFNSAFSYKPVSYYDGMKLTIDYLIEA